MSGPVTFRCDIEPTDPTRIRAIVESTGVFSPMEVVIAVELADERLVKGPASGYHFIFAERDGKACGYACYGPIALTQGSYDLFWIAVDKSARGAVWGGCCWKSRSGGFARRAAFASTSRPRRGLPTRPRGDSTSDAPIIWKSCSRISTPPATARRSTSRRDSDKVGCPKGREHNSPGQAQRRPG